VVQTFKHLKIRELSDRHDGTRLAHIKLWTECVTTAHLAELHKQEDDGHEESCTSKDVTTSHLNNWWAGDNEKDQTSLDRSLEEACVARVSDAITATHSWYMHRKESTEAA
jgi:hypothetical protein